MSEAAAPRGVPAGLDPTRLLSDERLVGRATMGDERAFAAIFRRYHQQLYRFSLAIVGNSEDAQDALQNTMIKAMSALPGEQRQIQLKPWLYRIAHNESIELLRRRRETSELDPDAASAAPGPAQKAQQRARLQRLVADMRELPDRQRGALVMRELAGLGFEEIGSALETSATAARQTLYEARLSLRQMEEGREMNCDSVTRALSDNDGRVIRRRDLRAHLRACPQCREFRDQLRGRRSDFAAISPLPAAAAAGILHAIFGGGGPGGGSLAGALGGGAAKVFGTSAAVKSAAAVAVVAAIGVTAADRGGLIDAGLPGGAGSRPAQAAGEEPGAASAAAVAAEAEVRSQSDGAAVRAAVSVGAGRQTVTRARAAAAARAAPERTSPDAPEAVPAGGGPGKSGAHRNDGGRHGIVPAAAMHGQQTAASHTAVKASGGNSKGAQGGAPKSHPVHPSKPAPPPHPTKPAHPVTAPPAKSDKSVTPTAVEAEKPAATAGEQEAQADPAEADK
ncbi:MAG TPA: RNA polymerase sigma factor [Solirubrobacterales bacterium]|jgi:RNA polymerase sigma factor (sigma-70 family)